MQSQGMRLDTDRKSVGITGAVLKWIAAITMFIDHIGAAILEPYAVFYGNNLHKMEDAMWRVDHILRGIGRLSFPIFIFLMVEGFFYTRSRRKYFLRLLAFCFVSEIPFDLAFNSVNPLLSGSVPFATQYQNVILTLAIGFLVIWISDAWRDAAGSDETRILGTAFVLAIGMGAAHFLHTDYGEIGVLCMFLAYLIKTLGGSYAIEMLAVVGLLTLMAPNEIFAIVDVPLVLFYQGKRGHSIGKWFFYAFYPGHLLLLWAVRVFICS